MTFVCNAGPVIALAKVDHLGLLRELADQVMIPERVLHEVLAKPGRDADRIVYAVRDFLEVRNPPLDLDAKVREASIQLDAGERDVVALAATTAHPVTAILDDAAGRRAANHLGIPVLGFIGLVLIAKKQQRVTSVMPLIERARNEGYWISDELVAVAAEMAEEQ